MGGALTGGDPTQKSSESFRPMPEAMPFFQPMYQGMWDGIQKGQVAYGRDTVAHHDPGSMWHKAITGAAKKTGFLDNGAQTMQDLAMKTATGGFMPDGNYTMNPQLQNVMDIAVNRSAEGLRQRALPGIRDAAIAGGAYGGGRQDIQENLAVQDFSRAATEATNQIGYQDYNDFMNRYSQMWNAERNRMQGAGSLFGEANDLHMAPEVMRLALADQTLQNKQRSLDNSHAMWTDRNRTAPTWGFPQMASILTAGGYGDREKEQPNPNYKHPLIGGLQMAMGLGSMASGIGSAGGLSGLFRNFFR